MSFCNSVSGEQLKAIITLLKNRPQTHFQLNLEISGDDNQIIYDQKNLTYLY